MIELIGALNLDSYMGEWFEMARKPAFFQNNCKSSKARYSIEYEDGKPIVKVINSCIKNDGKTSDIEGKARVNGERELSVKFSIFMNIFNKTNYKIFFIDTEYKVAIVGTPDKKYLWILSREILPRDEVVSLLNIAKDRGFDISDVIFDEH